MVDIGVRVVTATVALDSHNQNLHNFQMGETRANSPNLWKNDTTVDLATLVAKNHTERRQLQQEVTS